MRNFLYWITDNERRIITSILALAFIYLLFFAAEGHTDYTLRNLAGGMLLLGLLFIWFNDTLGSGWERISIAQFDSVPSIIYTIFGWILLTASLVLTICFFSR